MSKPNFFADISTLNCLLKMEFDEPERDIDFTLDFIDLPFWFSFASDDKTQVMKVYNQMDLYMKDPSGLTEAGSLTLNRTTGQATVKATQALSDNMGAFFSACRNISRFSQKEGLEEHYKDLDPEQGGILLTTENDVLHWKVVEGAERPELTVQTLFGGITTGRPYMEDFWDRSEKEMMSLEEKIEEAENGDVDLMMQLAETYLNGDEE